MVEERTRDYFKPCSLWRCLNCGAILDRTIYQHRVACKAEGVEMPKFLSEEHRAKWIAAQKRSREAKRKTENEPIVTVEDHDGEMEVPPPVPMGTVGRDPDWMVKALGGLYDRRSCLQGEMEKVEAAIQAVKALA
jgi:hypothetical protein